MFGIIIIILVDYNKIYYVYALVDTEPHFHLLLCSFVMFTDVRFQNECILKVRQD